MNASTNRHPNEPSDAILLASNGTKESDAAVQAALQLAAATHRAVKVIAVLEPAPLVAGEYGFVAPVEDLNDAGGRRQALLTRVERQIADVTDGARWPIVLRGGSPPQIIAKEALADSAALIVMGLGHHQLLDRMFGSETALHVVRTANTPVLAVPQSFTTLPTSAVAGVDFSGGGVAAVQRALRLLPTLTSVHLVHVAPRWDLQPTAYAEWRAEYERGVGPAFERVTSDLRQERPVTITTATREGHSTKELLAAASEAGADVIIVGSKGLGFLDRVLVGSTATGIIRHAECAVFALPVVATEGALEESAAAAAPSGSRR
ncbi:MAG: universal stress protein [Gemmatimonadaceae bacterium]